ncbi:MAG: hypothetical protein Fur006_40900 [Coleofasciculaceae cyanobacterium]
MNFIEKVKEFMVRLVKDNTFRDRLEEGSIDERAKLLEEAGYRFSKEEFEAASIELLESKERGEFTELTEEELVGVLGGLSLVKYPIIQPMYGVIWPYKPPIVQPMYGVIVSDV